VIGRGGMADVHAGHDTRLGRPVAIKLLRSDLARDTNFLARFRREAQSAAGLNHPSIVAIYDSGEDTSTDSAGAVVQVPYIVMERRRRRAPCANASPAVGHWSPPRPRGSPRACSARWPTATGWASCTATSSRPT
jgi:hypothetical protein